MADISERGDHLAEDGFVNMEYGPNAVIPPLNDEQNAMRALDFNYGEFEASLAAGADLEILSGLQTSRALKKIDALVADYVGSKLAGIGIEGEKLDGFKAAVSDKLWPDIPPDSPDRFVLRELIAKSDRLKFQLITKWLDTAESTGLTLVGELEYRMVPNVMAVNNRLYLNLVSEKFPIDTNARQERGMTNECAVVRTVGGQVVEVPYHEAFPQETAMIVSCYGELIEALGALKAEAQAKDPEDAGTVRRATLKIIYYKAVIEAFETSDIKKWRRADAMLTGQNADPKEPMHYHPIEIAYMDDRILRIPEVGLRIFDTDQVEAQRLADETQSLMLAAYRSGHFKDLPIVERTLKLLESSNVVMRHFLGSGMEMDLRPSGQILPNEFESRSAGGIDSSLDVNSAATRLPLKKAVFDAVFGIGEFDKRCAKAGDMTYKCGVDITSHELGHAIGMDAGIVEKFGAGLVGSYAEEWKATMGATARMWIPYLQARELAGDFGDHSLVGPAYQALEDFVNDHIAEACRYMKGRHSHEAHGYCREEMMICKVMEDVGILHFYESDEANPWKIDTSEAKVLAFWERCMGNYLELLRVYQDGDAAALSGYLEQNLRSTAFLDFAAERLPLPDGVKEPEKLTPEHLAKTPRQLLVESRTSNVAGAVSEVVVAADTAAVSDGIVHGTARVLERGDGPLPDNREAAEVVPHDQAGVGAGSAGVGVDALQRSS